MTTFQLIYAVLRTAAGAACFVIALLYARRDPTYAAVQTVLGLTFIDGAFP